MGGLGYLIIIPFILVTDWLFIPVDRYDIAEYVHSLALPWSIILTVIGLKELLGVKTAAAWGLALLSALLTIPLLAIFARQEGQSGWHQQALTQYVAYQSRRRNGKVKNQHDPESPLRRGPGAQFGEGAPGRSQSSPPKL